LRLTHAPGAGRHRFAFVPFGAGAHMCLELDFAYMQAKCFARHLARNLTVSMPRDAPAARRGVEADKDGDGR
jgi:cytochrome P450